MDTIAKGDFAVLSICHSKEGRLRSSASTASPVINQFPRRTSQPNLQYCALDVGSEKEALVATELYKMKDKHPLVLEMIVYVERLEENKWVSEKCEIRLYREPLLIPWIEKLIALFNSLPLQYQRVEAHITHQSILKRRAQVKSKTNNDIMGGSAADAFCAFLASKSIEISEDQLNDIIPEWCHIIMSSGIPLTFADSPLDLCCAPRGMNRAMRVPESMVAKLAEFLSKSDKGVFVSVDVALLQNTRILKSMHYKIETQDIKISITFANPFRAPHVQYELEGIAHLEQIMGTKLEKGGKEKSTYKLGC